MTTITLQGHIYASQASYESTPRYYFAKYDMSKHGEYAQVCQHTITAEIPEDFDIRPGLVEALKAEKSKILGEAQAKATAIEERISKLLALPNHG